VSGGNVQLAVGCWQLAVGSWQNKTIKKKDQIDFNFHFFQFLSHCQLHTANFCFANRPLHIANFLFVALHHAQADLSGSQCHHSG
jgi:hypothetical protein